MVLNPTSGHWDWKEWAETENDRMIRQRQKQKTSQKQQADHKNYVLLYRSSRSDCTDHEHACSAVSALSNWTDGEAVSDAPCWGTGATAGGGAHGVKVEAAAKCRACLPNPAAQQPEPETANCSLHWTYQALISRLKMWVGAGAELQSAAHLQRAVSVCVGSAAASGRGRTGCKAPSCPCWGAEFSGGSPPQPDRYCFQTPHWNTGGKRNTVESGFGCYFYF